MTKKLVILTGSPRRNGNSAAMAEAFIRAAEGRGFRVVRFDTAFMNIRDCRACGGCYSKGRACVSEDDFNRVAEELETADGVVLATPLYWYTFPAHIKAAIDKFYALYHGGRYFEGKKCALLACCEDEPAEAFDGMLFAYRKTIGLMRGENVGEVLVPGVSEAGAVAKTDGLDRAAALAERF